MGYVVAVLFIAALVGVMLVAGGCRTGTCEYQPIRVKEDKHEK